MRRLVLVLAAAPLALAAPAAAQTMDKSMPGMNMPGMKMPAKAKPKPQKKASAPKPKASPTRAKTPSKPPAKAPAKAPAKPPRTQTEHDMSNMPGMAMPPQGAAPAGAAHDMSSMPGMQMPATPQAPGAGHDMQAMPGMNMGGAQQAGPVGQPAGPPVGTDLPAGDAPPPPPPVDHAADRDFSPAVMARAREEFRVEQGGQSSYQVLFNLAEYQARDGRDGYRWDGEAWFGPDINRLVVKSEGEGVFREGVEGAEVQALFSHAIGPYFNLQAGVRQDFAPTPARTYATVGVEGLAPYMFETEAALFLSNKGDLLGRLSGWYDQRLTQRLILQPRVEFNLAAQDVPENGIGAGLTDAELGLRLRYEVRREFAPYIGVSYRAKTGRTATFARRAGEDPDAVSLVLGIRTWF